MLKRNRRFTGSRKLGGGKERRTVDMIVGVEEALSELELLVLGDVLLVQGLLLVEPDGYKGRGVSWIRRDGGNK